MQIRFKKEDLKSVANKINKIATLYKTNINYNNLKISIKDNKAQFKISSDLIYLNSIIDCESIENIDIFVNAYIFANTIANIDLPYIDIIKKDNKIMLKGDNLSIAIPSTNEESFIEHPKLEKSLIKQKIELNTKEFLNGIYSCLPFENPKSNISGLNFDIKDNKLRLCCCSESGASIYYPDNVAIDKELDINFTLNTQFLRDFKDIFSSEKIRIDVYSSFLNIISDTNELILRFLNKTFPAIEKVVPKDFKEELPVNKKEFEKAFDLIDIITQKEDASIIYTGGKCMIEHKEGVSFKINTNKELDIKFRVCRDLLRKGLKLIESNTIILFYNEIPKPLVIKDKNKIILISVLV